MRLVVVAPCQCFTFGGIQMTSPGWICRRSPPDSCTQPVPDVTMSVWPAGWVCHAVRAPGSNVASPPVACVCAEASNNGSITTEPVKLCAGPLPEGRDPFGLISMSFVMRADLQRHPLRVALPTSRWANRHRTPHGSALRRLRLRQAVIHRPIQVKRNLRDLTSGNQCADCHQTSVAGRKIRAQPQVTEQQVAGVLHEAWSDRPDIVLNRCGTSVLRCL